ncbi:hypothetical protein DQ384_08320 [Sphaerisporangium album]|uniref:Uncharacterized protein n=1 Tax=Sphaerisporangium album TaxID=509200 RepID=A0A367FMG1_9ACTN|nr:hypothetical protein [Sphaerisporangium album]RCG31568.1 hypothetical protein DQ384_08320 [Sphaerisporangium album]
MPDLTFVGHRRPVLPGGDYQIKVEQAISLDPAVYEATRTFTVAGERFALPPAAGRAVFPPDGSLGDHENTLPHIILDRATLPWERVPGGPADAVRPWLVLLVFSGDERPTPVPATLGTLGGGGYIPAPVLERHQKPDDPVTVIDVPRALLADIMPSHADLEFLAHIRASRNAAGDTTGDTTGGTTGDTAAETTGDTAVILANRLPAPGTTTTVHLVSVENRYSAAGFDLGPQGPDAKVRLISLANWRFACLDASHGFAGLAAGLADAGASLRLPDSGEPRADAFLRQGYVPVRHQLRQGGRTVSWYRGPFVTGPAPYAPAEPVRTSDALLRYHPGSGMFDTAYAAAWQLGRMIMLQHTSTATALYGWKRRRAQAAKRAVDPDHPLDLAPIDTDPPAPVLDLLTGLAHLRGVPLGYLIPDERLLPAESIRFLRIDRQWIAHLVDGAASIGRLTAADAELDRHHPPPVEIPELSGALIRSALVPGYPGLLIDAYETETTDRPVPFSHTERLSDSILLCLFRGEFARLDLHQHPESLHFAVELPAPGAFAKSLRDAAPLPAAPLGPRRTVPPAPLAARMAAALSIPPASFRSAAFARQMIETAERVTYLRG